MALLDARMRIPHTIEKKPMSLAMFCITRTNCAAAPGSESRSKGGKVNAWRDLAELFLHQDEVEGAEPHGADGHTVEDKAELVRSVRAFQDVHALQKDGKIPGQKEQGEE